MGKGPAKSQQTLDIINDRQFGNNGGPMTYKALKEKYNLSHYRIWEICRLAKIKIDMREFNNPLLRRQQLLDK